ncbi:MAG: hypothetical protein JW395_1949 [Nitrospira sp.]|nr:hypothetical protein [Nitrospira sp.]
MSNALTIAKQQWSHLPAGLIAHLERVSANADRLARRWHVDPEPAALAGYLHDIARAQSPDLLLTQARELGLPVNPVEESLPILLHGPVAAAVIHKELATTDESIEAAVCWHSTGRWGMTDLEKVVFIADKIDPDKLERTSYMQDVARLAEEDLNASIVTYIEGLTQQLLQRGGLIHPATVEARNWIILEMSKNKTATMAK